MADQYVTVEGVNSLLLALVATQAPAPSTEELNAEIKPFDARPEFRDREALRIYREHVELGAVAEWRRLSEAEPERAAEVEAYWRRLSAWQARYEEHRKRCIREARFRLRVEWAAELLAAVHSWERREF